jgi:hypothetical protein
MRKPQIRPAVSRSRCDSLRPYGYASPFMPLLLRPRHTYDPAHYCIYCGDKDGPFGDEHIVPRNMGGALVLKNASCKCCERTINSEIETPVANQMGTFRRRILPARNRDKKRRPPTYNLQIVDAAGNIIQEHVIPASEAPRVLYLITFPPLGLLSPHTLSEAPVMWRWAHRGDMQKLKSKYGGKGHTAGPYDVDKFARQLAKIAHSYVVAEYPEMKSYEQLLSKFILTGDGDFRSFIGCSSVPLDSDPRGYIYKIHWGRVTIGDFSYLVSRFRVFAFTNAPVYEVVVARKPITQAPLEPLPRLPAEAPKGAPARSL